MQRRRSAPSPKRWAERTIRRRGSSTPTSTPVIRRQLRNSKPRALWRRTADIDRCSTFLGTGSPGHQTPGARKPTFSFILGSLAYDRRLRGDSYDTQRPSVLECGECEGRSAARLHSRSVHCDKLNFRSSTPTLARLQSCNTSLVGLSSKPLARRVVRCRYRDRFDIGRRRDCNDAPTGLGG